MKVNSDDPKLRECTGKVITLYSGGVRQERAYLEPYLIDEAPRGCVLEGVFLGNEPRHRRQKSLQVHWVVCHMHQNLHKI